MSRQTIVIVLGAVVLFVVGVFGAMALTGTDSSPSKNVHTMPGGSTMTEPMATTEPTHTMTDGETMPGMTHETP
jgi:hypothetical protein